MSEPSDIALIERYIRGELSLEERGAVEQRMAEDADFRALLEDYEVLTKGIAYSGRKAVLERLQNLDENLEGTEATVRSIAPRKQKPVVWLAAAAVVALLFYAGFSLFNAGPDAGELYAAYYEPYPNLVYPITRSNTTAQDPAAKPYRAYEQKDYEAALAALNADTKSPEDTRLFYKGHTLLALNQPEEAIEAYDALLTLPNLEQFSDPARWYKALALLKLERVEEARSVLQSLENSAYSKESKELLEKL